MSSYQRLSGLEGHRQRFIRDIRNFQIQRYKSQRRTEMIVFHDQSELQQLIQKTNKRPINQNDLTKLVKFANAQYQKAVCHIGNLLLDGLVSIQEIGRFKFVAGYHPYWLWLIEILAQKNYCTLQLFEHCVKTINPKRSQKSVKSALSILYKITQSQMNGQMLFNNSKNLLSILNACFRNDQASSTAYLLMYKLINQGGNRIRQYLQVSVIKNKLFSVLNHGLLKIDVRVRKFCCKIIKQLAIIQLAHSQIKFMIVRLIKAQCTLTQIEFLIGYLMQMLKKQQIQWIFELIDEGLLLQMLRWKNLAEQNQQQQIINTIYYFGKQLTTLPYNNPLFQKRIKAELLRLNLLDNINYNDFC